MVRILILLLLLGSAQAQTLYCGQDTGLSNKVTLSNLSTYSEDLSDASWTKTRTTISANSVIAPNGELTADTIVATATTNSFYVYKAVTGSPTIGEVRRTSAFIKRGSRAFAVLVDEEALGPDHGARVDLSTCAVVDSSGVSRAIAFSVGNGWCEAIIEYTVLATGAVYNYVALWDGTAAGLYPSFAATTADFIYAWGIQHNLASSPVDYIATTASAVSLAGVCASGTTQSPTDPSKCIALGNGDIRKW